MKKYIRVTAKNLTFILLLVWSSVATAQIDTFYGIDGFVSKIEMHQDGNPYGVWVEYYPGSVALKSKTQYFGKGSRAYYSEYWPTGNLRYLYSLVRCVSTDDFCKNKRLKFFDRNGILRYTLRFRCGIKAGWSKGFYPNGKVCYHGRYQDDKKVGKWKYFDENGKKILTPIEEIGVPVFEKEGDG
jgi:antitoxin component YwqK of YwqJK toxin-antitoxin module